MSSSPVLFLVDAAGTRRVDPREPHLAVNDWGVTRGDGIFESISVIAGRMPDLKARLDRLEASARALDLPVFHRSIWTEALRQAIEAHDPVERLAVTIVTTRGVEGRDGPPTAWLLARPARDFTDIRRSGVSVVTLDRGYASNASKAAPWLLLGAKHLSYATNTAALREASRRGADDVIFTSTDGFALEGPTSSLVVRRGDMIVPVPRRGSWREPRRTRPSDSSSRRAFELDSRRSAPQNSPSAMRSGSCRACARRSPCTRSTPVRCRSTTF
jgi:4-amino-4-deoxychorismate lyase